MQQLNKFRGEKYNLFSVCSNFINFILVIVTIILTAEVKNESVGLNRRVFINSKWLKNSGQFHLGVFF